MLMSQTVHLRAASSSPSHPHRYRVPRRPQVPASARPSPEVTLRKPLGVLLTLLESTLARVLASVDSKGLADYAKSFRRNTYKKPGEGGRLASSLLIPPIFVALVISPLARAQQKSLPHQVSQIEVYESSEDLRESLLEKPQLQFGSSRIPALTIEVDDSVTYQQIDGFGASLTDSSA